MSPAVQGRASSRRAYASLWIATLVWGASFPVARYLLQPGADGQAAISPLVLAALRFSIASALMLIPAARALRRTPLGRADWWHLVLLGQVGVSIYFWLQYVGVQKTNAGISSIVILGLIPVFTAVAAWLLRYERFSWMQVVALGIGIGGVWVLGQSQNGAVAWRGNDMTIGLVALVANAACFAIYALLARRLVQRVPTLTVTAVSMTSGALALLLVTLANPGAWNAVARLHTGHWLAVFYLALVCSVAAYYLFNFALTVVPASRAAFLALFEPVVAVALGSAFLGERLTLLMLGGAALIALSVALVLRRGSA